MTDSIYLRSAHVLSCHVGRTDEDQWTLNDRRRTMCITGPTALHCW